MFECGVIQNRKLHEIIITVDEYFIEENVFKRLILKHNID